LLQTENNIDVTCAIPTPGCNNRKVNDATLARLMAAALLAVPVTAASLQAPGVPNFHKVNEHVYRGGQPSEAGWASLTKVGIKTVIDLRVAAEHSIAQEASAVEAAGMHFISQPMPRLSAPETPDIVKILAFLDSDTGGPVFVHCRRGAERTGTVIACYRITHDHWSNLKALEEAKSYGLSRLELGMRHFIQNFHLAGTAADSLAVAH
jgi:uncharacterized protein (TIGR01244 family)